MVNDYHMHTALCKHASGSLTEYAREAKSRGIAEICATDHIPSPNGYDSDNRMEMVQFGEYRNILQGSRTDGLSICFGIEADYHESELSFQKKWLPEQKFDFVLGSVHYIRDWAFDNPSKVKMWQMVDVAGVWKAYFKLIVKLAKTGLYDCVAHFDLPKKFGYTPPEKEVNEIAKPALDAVAKAGMSIEINTSGLRNPAKEIYPSPFLVQMARQRGISICFGSDSHRPDQVGYAFDTAIRMAKSAGYKQYAAYRGRKKQLLPLP